MYEVLFYRKGHSTMIIGVNQVASSEILYSKYWVFEEVQYFEGPMWWEGTDFEIGTASQCLELVRKLRAFKDIPDSDLSQYFKLFTASVLDNNFSKVQILAASGTVTKENLLNQYLKGNI